MLVAVPSSGEPLLKLLGTDNAKPKTLLKPRVMHLYGHESGTDSCLF